MSQEERLLVALNRFIDTFELVFETDWEHSKACMKNPRMFDCEESFLYPATTDENNNWSNRGLLLSSYRDIVSVMMKQGIRDPQL